MDMKNSAWFVVGLVLLLSTSVLAEQHLRLATTTSTDNSGLLALLNPAFENESGVKVDVIAVGTGKALRLGENGDVDVLLVHAPAAELKFVAAGFGTERLAVMHNDFVILGPELDPSGLTAARDIRDAMTRLATAHAFISRGDDSGTHKKELALWRLAGAAPVIEGYMAVGQGTGAVLRIADEKGAYTLTDRGTYLAFKDKIALQVVFSKAPELFNPYHVILLNKQLHPHLKAALARQYADFLRGEKGQRIIREFKIAGEQLFYPDVIK